MFNSDVFRNSEFQKNKLDVIDKLLFIAEETMFYKSSDSEEDLKFMRKMTLRLLKNQKFYLSIALDIN